MSDLKIRFNLSGKSIKRKIKKGNKPLGTQQIVAIISWGKAENIDKVKINDNSGNWKPLSSSPTNKEKYRGGLHFGWAGMSLSDKQKRDTSDLYKHFRSYKINVNGELLKYNRTKIQTGLFILPICWAIKAQFASVPYAWVNDELTKIKHVIETTYNELFTLKKFNSKMLRLEIQDRMKNGMPKHIHVPANIAVNSAQAIHEISKTLAKEAGIEAYDIRNPKNVPDNLAEFIDHYYKFNIKLKKGSDETKERHMQFKRKLARWNEATGKNLSITLSDEVDVGEFLKWRIFDNEENIVRNSKNVKSKNQITKVKDEAIAVSTLNKTKKDIIFFYNRSVDNFSCKPTLSTKHAVLKEEQDDRENYDVFLSMDQIKEILALKIEEGTRLFKHRILFCLGCLGGGYRVSDLVKLPQPVLEKFGDEFYYTFNVRSTKTKVRTKAPIPQQLNFLVENYKFEERVKVHDFRDDIKKLGELCGWSQPYTYKKKLADGTEKDIAGPYFKFLMTRTCRKSYCSLLFNYWELPILECMEFSGHKTEDEFKKYLQIDKQAKAQKLIEVFKVKPIFIG